MILGTAHTGSQAKARQFFIFILCEIISKYKSPTLIGNNNLNKFFFLVELFEIFQIRNHSQNLCITLRFIRIKTGKFVI